MIKNLKPTYEAKDEDEESYSYGCYDLNATFDFVNESEESCEFIRCFVSVNLPNGTTLCCSELDDNEVSIGQGESHEVGLSIGPVHEAFLKGFEMKDLTVSLIVNAYAEEFKKLGSWDCPAENECFVVEEKFEFGDFARIDGVAVRRAKNNEYDQVEFDGTAQIVLKNLTDSEIPWGQVKLRLIDKKGEMISDNYHGMPVPANGLVKEAPAFYDVKPSQAKGATLEVSASCYKTHLGKFSEEASPELNEW